MLNYLSKFSAHLSELAEPIRELSKKKFPFNWGPEHQETFKLMKKEVVAAPILAYYNPGKKSCKQTEESRDFDLEPTYCKMKDLYISQARH